MYPVPTTEPMPSEILAASAAVSSVQCAAPTWPGLWHDAQLACSDRHDRRSRTTGCPSARGADAGAAIAVGTVNFDGSSAVSFIVSVTSSEVLTSPAMLIGPMPNVDIFTFAVAVAVSLPPATLASTFHVTAAGVCFTVSWLDIVKWYGVPSVIDAGSPEKPATVRLASG